MAAQSRSIFDPKIIVPAIGDAFKKLNPVTMVRNPVMFVTEVGALVTTVEVFASHESKAFTGQISVWLWFTVLFANFAEAMAEGRGKAQANTLRASRTQTTANRLRDNGKTEQVSADQLRKGDVVLIVAGEAIPGDGEIIEGAATVDESAITGESAPVIREAGGDRSSVTGGTRVLSDEIKVRISANPGESFLDRMIGLVEGAKRQKTPNEIALTILLSALTIIFLLVCMTLLPFGKFSGVDFSPDGAHRAAGVLDPDDHRRLVERHRHRGHRPSGAKERAGHERARRGSRGRRGRAPARQDGHHHARQPAGRRVYPRPGRHGARTRRRRAAFQSRGRDSRRPLHRRARQAAGRHPRPRTWRSYPTPSLSRSRRKPA